MTAQEFWVFGYGSLLWRPGFEYVERRLATLEGFARSFCMYSYHYRGTEETPGLVLALDPHEGAACHGVGFRVAEERAEEVLAYLRERELVSYAYLEERHPVRFHDGGEAEALCYIINREHEQYAGGLDLAAQAKIIARAEGGMGRNDEYLWNTVAHLEELGIRDAELEELAERVKAATRA